MKRVREDREAGSEGRTRRNSPVDSRTGQGPMWRLAQFEDYVVNPNSIAPATHPGPHILSKIDCSHLQHGSAALGGIGGKTLISHLGLWGTEYTPTSSEEKTRWLDMGNPEAGLERGVLSDPAVSELTLGT